MTPGLSSSSSPSLLVYPRTLLANNLHFSPQQKLISLLHLHNRWDRWDRCNPKIGFPSLLLYCLVQHNWCKTCKKLKKCHLNFKVEFLNICFSSLSSSLCPYTAFMICIFLFFFYNLSLITNMRMTNKRNHGTGPKVRIMATKKKIQLICSSFTCLH